ncbi:MAG: hypothetical protein ACKVU1_01400 [bacterium]
MSKRLLASVPTLVLSLVALTIGCGDEDGPGPGDGCTNCQYWTQLTVDGGQFPAVHPSRPNVIAYSSRSANAEDEAEDIWIREEVTGAATRYYRVTDDAGDERLPSWSPDGRRLCFSRFANGRYDLWIVDVSDPENPTDLVKITSLADITGEPNRSAWRDDARIIFSNGDDIYQHDAAGTGSFEELVPDPADAILGLGLRFTENQPSFCRDPISTQELMAFVSEGRGPQGNIYITAFAESGEELFANVSIDGKPLQNPPPNSDTLLTPVNVFGIAPGDYVVGVNVRVGPDDFCDTTLVLPVRVGPNQVVPAEFIFERPRGAIRVVGPPTDGSTRLTVYRRFEDGSLGVPIPTGSVLSETTYVDCLFESEYLVRLERVGELEDSASVFVCGRRVSQVCLTVSQEGCPDSLPTVACIDTLVYEPPPGKNAGDIAASTYDWAAKSDPALLPQQTATDLWFYDFGADSLSRLTQNVRVEKFPACSPDGRFIAFIEDINGIRNLRIMSLASRNVSTVPLPGRSTTRVCNRSVLHPAWTPSGSEIVVSLTNCDDEIETNEVTDIWVVDVSGFLPP